MSSTAEAEMGGFINAKEAVHVQNIFNEMGHSQPPTPFHTGNLTAKGVLYNRPLKTGLGI